MSAIRWFLSCAVTAAILLIACGFATARFGGGLQMPATTTRDGTLITLNRYMREPVPDIVLVGSSVAFRFKEEYFAAPRLRNLALAGGSPVTGLEIVASRPRIPSVILVEANVLSRPTDTELVERYSRENAEPLFFRPLRAAVAAYENTRHMPMTNEQVAAALARLVAQPPSDFDSRVYTERAVREFNAEDPSATAAANARRIGELIVDLERRGAQVLLFEQPFSLPVEAAHAAVVTRNIIHAAFPDPARWLKIDVDRSELRWPDGVHLDERSAVIFTRSMERALAIRRSR
ncbi:MAG: hypothetical protein PS018_01180 [bacterium]|nr:hypothetical protein [bacterium]